MTSMAELCLPVMGPIVCATSSDNAKELIRIAGDTCHRDHISFSRIQGTLGTCHFGKLLVTKDPVRIYCIARGWSMAISGF